MADEVVEALCREIGHIANISLRCTMYGPADALRDHIARAMLLVEILRENGTLPPSGASHG